MTLLESVNEFKLRLGMLFRVLGKEMQPDYWACANCRRIVYLEREVICWKCGIGKMIYKGDVS